MRAFNFIIVLLTLTAISSTAYAQSTGFETVPGIASSVVIVTNPAYPAPRSTVQLKLQSPLINLSTSQIVWRVNGKNIQSGIGMTQIDILSGDIGSTADIDASIVSDYGLAQAAITLTPAAVDLVWEADSYTPPFYKGRALPGPGTKVHLFAVPQIVTRGKMIAPEALTFTWQKNGALLAAASGAGKSSLITNAPILFGTDVYTVTVTTNDETVGATASVSISTQDPLVLLYADNPLFGIMYNHAIQKEYRTDESELSLVAIPYFIQPSRISALTYVWRVNGQAIEPNTKNPGAITISTKNGGAAALSLSLYDPKNIFLNSNTAWNVSLASKDAAGQPAASDAFHQGQ